MPQILGNHEEIGSKMKAAHEHGPVERWKVLRSLMMLNQNQPWDKLPPEFCKVKQYSDLSYFFLLHICYLQLNIILTDIDTRKRKVCTWMLKLISKPERL